MASSLLAAYIVASGTPAFATGAPSKNAPITANQSTTGSLSSEDLAYLQTSFEKLNIPESKHQSLINAVSSGELLDSDKGKEPSTVSKSSNPDGTVSVTKRWPDGSATRTTDFPANLESTLPIASPASVTGCRTVSKVGMIHKTNCQVWHQAITWSAGFTASFRYSMSNGHYIKSISNPKTGGIGMGSGTLSYTKRSSPSSGTAQAQLIARQTLPVVGIPTSRDVGVYLNVSTAGGKTSSFGA